MGDSEQASSPAVEEALQKRAVREGAGQAGWVRQSQAWNGGLNDLCSVLAIGRHGEFLLRG